MLFRSMGDNTSKNRDNMRGQLPIRGHLGNVDPVEEPERPRTLREHLVPKRNAAPSCIRIPPHAGTFHFCNGMISLLPQFYGIENEKACLHLREFDKVCETFSDQTCPKEITNLKLFPFTLKEKSKAWLLSLKPRSIFTWSALHGPFLKKFFPNRLTTDFMRQIKTFS